MAFLHTTGIRLDELAKAVNAQVRGARETILTGVNNLDGAGRGDLVCVTGARFIEAARRSKAGAFLVATPLENFRRPQLITPNPQYDFNRLINQFFTIPRQSTGIAEGPWRGEEVEIGPDASIGPFVTLGHRAKIGARVTLFPGVYVGDDVQIGDDSILYPNVAILERCIIGSRVIVHCGTVIGSDHLMLGDGERANGADDLTLATAIGRHVRGVLDRADGDAAAAAKLLRITKKELDKHLAS